MNGWKGCGLCVTQWDINQPLKRRKFWTFLAIQWLRPLASNAGGVGSVLGQGSRIPHTAWCGQKASKKRLWNSNMPLEDIMYFEDTMLSKTSSKKIKTVSGEVKSRQKAEWCCKSGRWGVSVSQEWRFSFVRWKEFCRWMVVMLAKQCKYTYCYWTVHFKMTRLGWWILFLCVFYRIFLKKI